MWKQVITKIPACKGEEIAIFFPEPVYGPSDWSEARKICSACTVASQCLEEAVINEIADGMWGGKTPIERKRIRRAR